MKTLVSQLTDLTKLVGEQEVACGKLKRANKHLKSRLAEVEDQ